MSIQRLYSYVATTFWDEVMVKCLSYAVAHCKYARFDIYLPVEHSEAVIIPFAITFISGWATTPARNQCSHQSCNDSQAKLCNKETKCVDDSFP